MLYRIRVWEGLFSIWVIMLYRIRMWGGGVVLYLGNYVV